MDNNWPADKIEKRNINALIPYARNAKKHPEAQVSKIAASIKEWGWTNPVLIDTNGGIIAGHGRVLAAQKLGIEEVPVMVAEGWSQAKIKAYCIADNKLAESDWDEELLALELQELGEMDFDLDLLGFDETELDLLLGDDDVKEGLTDEDAVPDVPVEPVTKMGDVWLLGAKVKCPNCSNISDASKMKRINQSPQ